MSETGEFDSDDATDNRERVLTSIVRRRGQPEFRQMLMKIYGGACAVTGYNAEYALEAAHIRPFRGGHTNHPTNGLLLRADKHTLFDLHLLAIDTSTSKMTILLAPQLLDTPYKSLTGKPLQSPQNNSHLPNKEALDEHRAKSGL